MGARYADWERREQKFAMPSLLITFATVSVSSTKDSGQRAELCVEEYNKLYIPYPLNAEF